MVVYISNGRMAGKIMDKSKSELDKLEEQSREIRLLKEEALRDIQASEKRLTILEAEKRKVKAQLDSKKK
eukprot:snap_masked-scaffold552_size138156-processed-gene-0.0 protein:Tk00644 transcript:snap_masked-scaffold552_size138156-processed-gene-0.0-mRNA-1 annotation:"bzip transcription factor"